MLLKSFRVTKFRNIVDSGSISVDPMVTCLVGKNEAGKSGLLEALYLFNPAYEEEFSINDQYPRWLVVRDRKTSELSEHSPISVTFELEEKDIQAVVSILGEDVLTGSELIVEKKYDGSHVWSIPYNEAKAVKNLIAYFPSSLNSYSELKTLDELKSALETTESESDESPSSEEVASAISIIENIELNKYGIEEIIINILRQRLPHFFLFTSYSTLPGRIDFREIASSSEDGPAQSSLQTAKALLSLAGTDFAQLENDDYELRKGELEAVQIDLTNQVFEYWKQNPHLEVLIDVDKETVQNANNTTAVSRFLDIRLRDKRTGYSNNFTQRSSGFQWFFSFLAAFSEFENHDSPIVLLDEPALTLHGKAQADFLRFINERLAPNSPVLYTTHSPFMVEIDRLERIRIVEDKGPPLGAVASDEVLFSDPDSLFPLQAALGYDIAQSLFVGKHNLVVEGTSDFIYLTLMSKACKRAGMSDLDDRWRILPAGGATNIPTFVSLIGPHLEITVLADSDTKGMQRVTNMTKRGLLKSSRLILASDAVKSDHADIEDLFSEGDYLKLYNKTFSKSLKINELPSGNRIVKRIEAYLGVSYDHGEVAETLLRNHNELSFTGKTLERFQVLVQKINQTIIV